MSPGRSRAPLALAAALALSASGRAFGGPPDCAEHVRAAELQYARDNTPGVWKHLEKARRCAEDGGVGGAERAVLLRDSGALRARLGDVHGAESELKRALELAPGDADAALVLATILRDRPEDALPWAERAAGSSGTAGAAGLRVLAGVFADLGDEKAARASLSRALERSPDDLEALAELARLERGRPEAAEPLARRAAAAAEAAPAWLRGGARRRVARMWLDLGRPDEASGALRRALAADRDDLLALEALEALGGPAPAPFEARPAAAAPALELDALRRAFEERRRPGRRPAREELFAFDAEIERSPGWQQAAGHRWAAEAWLAAGESTRAEWSQKKAVLLEDDSIDNLLLSRRLWTGKGASGPRNLQMRLLRAAFAYKTLGDLAAAEDAAVRALALAPDAPEVLRFLDRLRRGRARRS